MNDEYEELIGAIIFWRGALSHQYTPETQAFAREQIARLEKRANELAEPVPESASPDDCPHGGTCSYAGECPFRRVCLSEADPWR